MTGMVLVWVSFQNYNSNLFQDGKFRVAVIIWLLDLHLPMQSPIKLWVGFQHMPRCTWYNVVRFCHQFGKIVFPGLLLLFPPDFYGIVESVVNIRNFLNDRNIYIYISNLNILNSNVIICCFICILDFFVKYAIYNFFFNIFWPKTARTL